METVYIIGIAGGSGSGKSTFAKRLKEYFSDDILLINCDDYYLPHDELTYEQRTSLNYDIPDAIEFPLLVEHIKKLKSGESVERPIYDFGMHTRAQATQRTSPKKVIIIDGILCFTYSELMELLDLKIYVETDADERILRRVKRDICDRNRDIDSIINQYLSTVKPMHALYVEPTKEKADIIINGGLNCEAYDLVKTKIENILK